MHACVSLSLSGDCCGAEGVATQVLGRTPGYKHERYIILLPGNKLPRTAGLSPTHLDR